MAKANTAAIVRSLNKGQYEGLPEGFDKRDALKLVVASKIDEDVYEKFIDHLINESKREYMARPNGLKMKVGEKNWITLSGGYLGVSWQRPVTLKANTLLALLVHHKDELIEFVKSETDGEYDIETRSTKNGSYDVLLKGNCVVGSADSKEKIENAKGLLNEWLS